MISEEAQTKDEQGAGQPVDLEEGVVGSGLSARSIARNSLIIGATKIGQVLLGLIYIAMISRYLGVDRFGKYSVLWAATTFGITVPAAGLNNILIREIARNRAEAPRYLGAAIMVRRIVGAAIVAIVVAAVLLWHPPRTMALAVYFALAWAYLQLSIDVNAAVFLAYERMEYDAIVALTNISSTIVVTAFAIQRDWGLPGIFGATAVTNYLASKLGTALVRRKFVKPRMEINVPQWRAYIKEAMPVGLSRVLKEFYSRLGVFMLTWLSTSASVALFNGAYRIVVQLNFIPMLLVRAAYPSLSRLAGSAPDKLAYACRKYFKILVIVALPMAVMFSMLSRQIILLVLGPKFVEASKALTLLGWAATTMFPDTLFWFVLVAINRQMLGAASLMACVAVNILLDLLLIPHFGFVGACFGTLTAELTFFAVAYSFVRRALGPLQVPKALAKPVMAGVVMAAALYPACDLSLFLSLPIGLLTYLLAVLFLRVFDADERQLFRRLLQRTEGKGAS